MSKQRVIIWCTAVAALAGCGQVSMPRLPGSAPAPAPTHTGPDPTPAGVPAASPQSQPPVVVTPATVAQAHKLALSAQGLLENGQEDQAREELQRALANDPNNKLAQNLMRQIINDPLALLGRESFSYTVQPNDSMSSLARRFLGDIHMFYALARYNGIAVPRLLAGGQVLRIPGKAPPPAAAVPRDPPKAEPAAPAAPPVVATAPPPPREPSAGERAMQDGEKAERGGDLDRALSLYTRAATLEHPGAEAKLEQVRKQLVQRHSFVARTAFARQDLDGAVRAWDRVLNYDPSNATAKFERQRALDLKEKVKKL